MIRSDFQRRSLAWLCFIWIVAIPTIYYKHLWQIPSLGIKNWIADNPSVEYLIRSLRAFEATGLTTPLLPYAGEALSRALIAMLGFALIFIAAQTLGAGICALIPCQFDNRIEKVVYRAGIGFGALAYLSLGLATIGNYRPAAVRLLILITAAIGVWLFLRYLRQLKVRNPNRTMAVIINWRASPWPWVILLAAAIALIGALAPETEYDALWYHLWLPRLWLEKGSPVDLMTEYISLYPMTWDLVFGAGLTMGGAIAAKLANFSCLILSLMTIFRMTRHNEQASTAWMAGAIWITTPTILWEGTTAYNDLAVGFYLMLTLDAALRFVEGRERQWLLLAGLNAGFALGVKHLAGVGVVLIAAGLGLMQLLTTRKFKSAFLSAMILAAIALTIASPWYYRSWRASGNPVFPEFYSIFGAKPPQRWDAITERELDEFKARFGRPRTFSNLITLPWDMTIHAARYGGNLGPLYLMFIPGLLLRRNRTPFTPCLIGYILLFLLFWASPLSSYQMRFLVPITPALAMLAAEGAARAQYAARELTGETGKRILNVALLIFCLFNLPPFTSLHEYDREDSNGWLTHVIHTVPFGVVFGKESEAAYLARAVPSFDVWQYINTQLPVDCRVLTFRGGDHFYSYRQRIPGDATIARSAVWIPQRNQETQLLEQLSALGITHILFDKKGMAELDENNLAIVQPEVISKWYAKEYEDENFLLYRLLLP